MIFFGSLSLMSSAIVRTSSARKRQYSGFSNRFAGMRQPFKATLPILCREESDVSINFDMVRRGALTDVRQGPKARQPSAAPTLFQTDWPVPSQCSTYVACVTCVTYITDGWTYAREHLFLVAGVQRGRFFDARPSRFFERS